MQEDMNFPKKRLTATWFAPPPELYESLPRIFFSELRVHEMSREAQAVVEKYTSAVRHRMTPLQLWSSLLDGTSPWTEAVAKANYDLLLKESEYAAW